VQDEMEVLLDAVRNHDNELACSWSHNANWSTLQELMKHSDPSMDVNGADAHTMDAEMREAIERSLQMQ